MNKAIRATVRQRAGENCEYCKSQLRFSPDPFSVEHIIPRSKGGNSGLDNLAFSCQGCNGHKFTAIEARDTLTDIVVALFNPRKELWNEHFIWSEGFSLIIGISPIGRATIERLQLNRTSLVNLRTVLTKLGKHPPVAG